MEQRWRRCFKEERRVIKEDRIEDRVEERMEPYVTCLHLGSWILPGFWIGHPRPGCVGS